MLTTATSPASFVCTHDTAHRQVRACWTGPTTDAELYAHYAELMALAEAHGGCRFWLLDVRGRNVSSSVLGRWFGNEFAPLAHAAFGKPLFLAYVADPQHRSSVNSPGAQAMQHSCAAHDVYSFYFDSLPAAQDWLAHQQAHDEEARRRPAPEAGLADSAGA